jgi:hypothetical protein
MLDKQMTSRMRLLFATQKWKMLQENLPEDAKHRPRKTYEKIKENMLENGLVRNLSQSNDQKHRQQPSGRPVIRGAECGAER